MVVFYMEQKEYYTIKEASEIMGYSIETVRSYIKQGIIKTKQMKKRARHFIPRLEIPTYARNKRLKQNGS